RPCCANSGSRWSGAATPCRTPSAPRRSATSATGWNAASGRPDPRARRGRARGPGLLSPEAGAATGDGEEDAVKVVIADDEPLARERLRALLAAHGDVEVVAEAGVGRAALQACAEHEPDLVLLDIAMPGIDGLEAARHLAAFEPRPAVVFCTAYDAHALSAFDAAAVDYLVKPVRAERLQDALERVRTFTAGLGRAREGDGKRRTHLCARLRGSLRLIPIEE